MIQVFSSFAHDTIVYQDNLVISWWPAFWIEQALSEKNATYTLHMGVVPWKVYITQDENGEDRGTIVSVSEIPFSPISWADIVLISTLRQEFSLMYLCELPNTVFLDIQWYLRWEDTKKHIDARKIISRWVLFIKATREEFGYIDFWEDSPAYYIVTDGGKNIELIHGVQRESISIQSAKFKDTIGAGDTFLANIAYYFEQTGDIYGSIQDASDATFQFLVRKNGNMEY